MVDPLLLALTSVLSPALADETSAAALARMVDVAVEYGPRAGFVFDLDETTVDSTPRRYESMLDALDEACGHTAAPPADWDTLRFPKLATLHRLRHRYDDVAFLRAAGAKDETFIATIAKRALEVYLSGRYVADKDRLFVGVQRFVKELKKNGAKVFFVSSRSIERQGRATLYFLEERGLIRAGEESNLYLKPDAEKSPDFKRRATAEIRARMTAGAGRVFGIFENEPENLAIWIENFPAARAFFVEGAYVKEGPVARKAVLLEDFQYSSPTVSGRRSD